MERIVEAGVGPEFLLSEANNYRARENIVVGASQTLAAGAILGRVTVGGAHVKYDPDAEDGSETVAGILYDSVTTGEGETTRAVAIVRDAEVIDHRLVYGDLDAAQKTAVREALETQGVIVRISV